MTSERGRPRTFNIDDALDMAVGVFWKQGFLNASLSELTAAMGVNKPSLYAAFGDKEALYLRALERYVSKRLAHLAEALDAESDGRVAVLGFLRALGALYADPKHPGCFVINGAADLGGTSIPPSVEQALRRTLQTNEARLRARLERARRDHDLPEDADSDALASFFMSTVAGMGVLAKAGAKRGKLDAIIDVAMAPWPARKPARHAKARSGTSSPGSTRTRSTGTASFGSSARRASKITR
jgi:AcrR family transcriptional regulator